jgi:predicted acetyltransferase
MTLCMFDDDRLASVHGSWPLTMRFNGKAIPISGVTTVSTDPIDRGHGHLRKLVTRHFNELHDARERPWAALYASQAIIYQRYGYAVVSTHHRYKIEPRHIEFAEPLKIPGSLREIDIDRDFGLMVDMYRKYREDRTGLIHRGKPMWDTRITAKPHGEDKKSVLVYEEDGEPLGCMVFTTGDYPPDPPLPGQKVVLEDMTPLTPLAYRAFWMHLGRMPLARFVEAPSVAADDPLPHLLLEPRMLRDTNRDGILARIIDLGPALDARRYQPGGVVSFELIDDLCTWNAGRWRASLTPGGAELEKLSGEPELSMTAATLAMIAFGQLTATQAADAGRVGVHDANALPRWDAAFRTRYAPFCGDNF